jgi:fermentation-respiration switch protein FrsA (DUF1100 family)
LVKALVIYLFWVVALYTQQSRMVFPRQYAGPAMKEGRLPPRVEAIWIESEGRGERVEAWYMPAGSADAKAPVMIFCHGNAELIDDCASLAMEWRKRGFAVLLPEYRGYGRSGGTPSQAAIVSDLVRFYDAVVARPEVDGSRVFAHGRSLGGGLAAQLAAVRPTAGLILESTFTSVASFAWGYGAPSWICTNPFRTDSALAHYDKPVLIFHGKDDNIIPVSHGRALHRLIARSTYVETEGDHIHYPPDLKAYWGEVDRWVRVVGSAATDGPDRPR